MSEVVWFLIVIAPWDSSPVVLPQPFVSQRQCQQAARDAVPIGHEWPVRGYCIPQVEARGERVPE